MSLEVENPISGNIIINYCRSVIQDKQIYICSSSLAEARGKKRRKYSKMSAEEKKRKVVFFKLCTRALGPS